MNACVVKRSKAEPLNLSVAFGTLVLVRCSAAQPALQLFDMRVVSMVG